MAEPRSRNIVVVGGGPAGVFAAIEAKRTDPAAHVVLLSDEACEPYEKPPLSKAVLTGKALPEHALIAGPGGTAKHNVVLEHAAMVTAMPSSHAEAAASSPIKPPPTTTRRLQPRSAALSARASASVRR